MIFIRSLMLIQENQLNDIRIVIICEILKMHTELKFNKFSKKIFDKFEKYSSNNNENKLQFGTSLILFNLNLLN